MYVMIEESSKTPILDSDQIVSLREALAGELDLARDLVETFELECDPALNSLQEAYIRGDTSEIKRLAHFMAGSAANIGLLRFSNLCRKIENRVLDGEKADTESIPGLLRDHYAEGLGAIRREFGMA